MSNWYIGWRHRLPGGFSFGWRRRLGTPRGRIGLGCGGFVLLACCAGACLMALPKASNAAPTPQPIAATVTLSAGSPTVLASKPTVAQPNATTAASPTAVATATLKPSTVPPTDTNSPPPATPTRQPAATLAPVVQSTATTAPAVAATQAIVPTSTETPPAPVGGGYVCPNGTACIKGNISSGGRKLYHFPGCGSYNSTKIDLSAGERMFVTAAEAEAAGWVKAGNCP